MRRVWKKLNENTRKENKKVHTDFVKWDIISLSLITGTPELNVFQSFMYMH